ncbi:MAG: lipopolysaccharide assembly protein LapA domain-containing protein [bacterium]|nr:lipopolysaccharide assembly protein LapA domain-containing protein [bacterium]
MFSVILLVIIALAFGVFATQNSINIPVTIAGSVIPDVPLYIVIGLTLLFGLFFAWVLSLVNSVLFSRTLKVKDHAIDDVRKENKELNLKITQLEIENTRLMAEVNKISE